MAEAIGFRGFTTRSGVDGMEVDSRGMLVVTRDKVLVGACSEGRA